ncbi:hypothetical protein [Cryptosporangium phraense]|uniref:Uncharacterized protein n=1 Tax=Cryptosporangium phraense TaxID=2593070 RepID=A0A545AS45_9ACTN|nr:hypothetical protein [Cryptosporangium phraense]TQS44144.1 hypothetical protein FL583_14390 [Cryptosporangium phraense]
MMASADHEETSPKVAAASAHSDERNAWSDPADVPMVDPWHVISYLISGVTIWGAVGWVAARWLDIPALIGVGFVIGGVLGIWLTYIRYGRPQSGSSSSMTPAQPDLPRASAPARNKSAQRPSGPPSSSDTTAEEEKP